MADASTHQQLDQMITGYWVSQAIYAAAKFGIADHLKDGPKTVTELANASSTDADEIIERLRVLSKSRKRGKSRANKGARSRR